MRKLYKITLMSYNCTSTFTIKLTKTEYELMQDIEKDIAKMLITLTVEEVK